MTGPLVSSCYEKAVEMAALVVVVLPVLMKTQTTQAALSKERSAMYATKYGLMIWRAWTLAMSAPDAEPTEADVKFRHFSLGTLYLAKYGFTVGFDLATVPDYHKSTKVVDAAMRSLIGERSSADCQGREDSLRTAFSKRCEITFFRRDPYLYDRLVPENKIGTKNTIVDGVQVDSVGVNSGIGLVKSALSTIAEWSKREFVLDVATRGIAPSEAMRSALARASDYFLIK
jgi:hypothetical protein